MIYNLTYEQRTELCRKLQAIRDKDDDFEIILDYNNVQIHAYGKITIDGYYEDDYLNGTGAFVETHRDFYIEIFALVLGEECDVDQETVKLARAILA